MRKVSYIRNLRTCYDMLFCFAHRACVLPVSPVYLIRALLRAHIPQPAAGDLELPLCVVCLQFFQKFLIFLIRPIEGQIFLGVFVRGIAHKAAVNVISKSF